MELRLYSLYDKKQKVFFPPTPSVNKGCALRDLKSMLEHKTGPQVVVNNPEDFDFYEVAIFNQETGTFTCDNPPDYIMNCEELIANE